MTKAESSIYRTVGQILDATVAAHSEKPAMRHKVNGAWQTTPWREYRRQARLTARGFMKLGLEAGQGVSIIGFNCPQWFMADVGAILAGGFPAGIYTTSSPEQCQYIADHSDSAIAVVEDAAQLAKLLEVRGQLPKLRAIVTMGDAPAEDGVYGWKDLWSLGEEVPEKNLDARIAAQKPDDTCTLIYTSGTTGNPKAVMITHANIAWTAGSTVDTCTELWEERFGNRDIEIEGISYLPLSHIAEQVVSLHVPMVGGGCTSFAESLEALGDNLREVRPTFFFAVPRVWEKIQAKIVAAAQGNKGLKKAIATWARTKGLEGGYAQQRGKPMPAFYGVADKLVFSKVRERLGLDRSLAQFTSAAPISKGTLEFFLSLGIPLYELYGMSECTGPATLSTPEHVVTGKVGLCLTGAELKIASDGEICMRGPHVCKGYYKNAEATRATIDDEGWLHSGDLGSIDGDGFLEITGRKKDLIITSGGENIAPQVIEGMLKAIPSVSQAVVIGDRRHYLTALLTLDAEKLPTATAKAGSTAASPEDAATDDRFLAFIQSEIEAVNRRLARVQTIKKFRILPEDFTVDSGELTPTMKVKRNVVNEKYAGTIESMYEAS